MAKEKSNNFIRSDEVQDILSSPPHALLRVGSSVISCVLFFLLIGCFVFKYPDTISCSVTITQENPPVWLVARSTGKLQELYVKDRQNVGKGQIVAVIENSACTADVLWLDSVVTSIRKESKRVIQLTNHSPRLGDIQNSYSTLVKAITDYNNFVNNNLYDQSIAAEEAQIEPYSKYVRSINRQLKYSRKMKSLVQLDFNRKIALYNKGLVSASDLENNEQSLLSSNMSTEQTQSSLSNAQIQMTQIRNNISKLLLEREQERRQVETSLQSALESVRTSIDNWKHNYILQSPIEGMLSYNSLWQINQNISAGDKAFAIISRQDKNSIGKALVPIAGSGKVRKGQRVNIKLDSYPYLEYGFLTGKVISISSMPDESHYMATLEIAKSSLTSYGKYIEMNGDLTGTADIVTEDLSVAARLIGPLKYLLYRGID